MINYKVHKIFSEIEADFKQSELNWGDYSAQMDWEIKEGNLQLFVRDDDPMVLKNNLGRVVRHDIRDSAVVDVLLKCNVTTILDVGADTGAFLAQCKSRGIDGIGIEPNKKAVEYFNKKYFIKLYCFDLETLMEKYKNDGSIEACAMMNTFHGLWKDIKAKETFTRYVAENFKYALLSDDYKNNKPDPVLMKYFDLVYDFNMYGSLALKDYKMSDRPLKKFKDSFYKIERENQIYEKMRTLAYHKLYVPKKR